MVYTVEQISQIVEDIVKDFGVKSVFLFGSYARGDADENSDVDLIIDERNSMINSLTSLSRLRNCLVQALNKEVDLLTLNGLCAIEHNTSMYAFIENVKREVVAIYG